MATGTIQIEARSAAAGERFYRAYQWCLDPMLSVRDLLSHLGEEIERYRADGVAGWEGAERRINLYLFVCAIACTVDDYLAAPRWSLKRFLSGKPSPRSGSMSNARVAAWRRQWTECVDGVCDLLLDGDGSRFFERARALLIAASNALDEAARRQRMRIPEAFRCQDLTHHDVCAMVRMSLPSLPEKDDAIVLIGPRTAGAYFAPLAAACLRARGYSRVSWISARPKDGFSRAESRAISAAAQAGARIVIIDDHPNSGHTLRLLLAQLRKLGADSCEMVALLPGHPSIPDFGLPDEAQRGVRIHLLPPEDRYKARLLDDYASEEMRAHYADGFQVRLKGLIADADGRRLMAKSVGWGWLGYHAWLAASALEGFVPRPRYLREGILYSEFVDGEPIAAPAENPEQLAIALADYIARRTNVLSLRNDPAFETPGYRWCGWDDLVACLSRIYGPKLGRFAKRAIRRRLRQYVAPNPVLVDGRMNPADWLRVGSQFIKTDFEHHNFGGGEADIVDPAWDLASAMYEFELQPEAEEILLHSYKEQTGDAEVSERLLLYKILYAMTALRAAKYWLARRPDDPSGAEWNRQFVKARSFAAFQMARYCGSKLSAAPPDWERRLFFLDLDGVFDWGLLGFPHTSDCGIRALRLLARNRFAVVLNTARSLEHVREYCFAYKLPGGVAELGSVFWDAVRDWEVPLIDAEALAQIEKLRDEIQALPGAFLDPENRYSIRAYRFQNGYMRPLADREVADAIERAGCDRLSFVQSQADTYIIQRGAGKGSALAAVKAYLGRPDDPVAAIGDSRQDVDMLGTAEIAFAPGNASREVRELVARGECRRMSRRLQAGLLEAATELCFATGGTPEDDSGPDGQSRSLIDDLLRVPDRRLPWWGIGN